MAVSPRLLRAWRLTRYVAEAADIRIGRRSSDVDRLLTLFGAKTGVLVTAWNPLSRRRPNQWNERMQTRLRQRLRRRIALQAEGAWRRWREDHFLVLADPRLVRRTARQFRQIAVVIVRRGQPAALMTSFPVFSPRNSMPKARGAFSSPSMT
jgi:hypothetical protein